MGQLADHPVKSFRAALRAVARETATALLDVTCRSRQADEAVD
jgi:hypothetical protein